MSWRPSQLVVKDKEWVRLYLVKKFKQLRIPTGTGLSGK
jgi:hypothetical protein